jgi:hypothetical protein
MLQQMKKGVQGEHPSQLFPLMYGDLAPLKTYFFFDFFAAFFFAAICEFLLYQDLIPLSVKPSSSTFKSEPLPTFKILSEYISVVNTNLHGELGNPTPWNRCRLAGKRHLVHKIHF